MIIRGLDTGYKFTKDNNFNIFKSCFSPINTSVVGAHEIDIEGKTYYVGIGTSTVSANKVDSELTKACVLTNLCLTKEKDYEYKLVVGLPIKQYNAQKDHFRDTILDYSGTNVVYGGEERKIIIDDVYVFPQGAAAYYSMNDRDGDYILVDIGGLTVDVAYIEQHGIMPRIAKADTWYKGMLTLFSSVIEAVNNKYETTLDPEYAERILTGGLKIFGEEQDLGFLDPILSNYMASVIDELMVSYPFKTVPIYLCGGGATVLQRVFQKHFPNCTLITDPQFANAIGMYQIGLAKWGAGKKNGR